MVSTREEVRGRSGHSDSVIVTVRIVTSVSGLSLAVGRGLLHRFHHVQALRDLSEQQ